MDRSRYPEVARYLASLAQVSPTPARVEASSPDRAYKPYTRQLRLNPHAPLLAHKGIDVHTARRFEAGACQGTGFLEGCVAIRLHDPQGRSIGYAGRRLDPEQIRQYGKWKFPSGLPKREILPGFHRITSRLHQALVVVECPWGVMHLDQIGIPAVALLGTHLSRSQLQLLRRTSRIVLMLDGDRSGRSASHQIADTLNQYTGASYRPGSRPRPGRSRSLRTLAPACASPALILSPNLTSHLFGIAGHYAGSWG
ncbi:MAG: toprim domain-containing protein [Pseudomonadota bacterium]|nr:toprim domain-containing protein [Pseudomonadota bacterium]